MRRLWPLPVLLALLFAVWWITTSIINAVSGDHPDGGVFWSAIVMLLLIDAALLWGTWRTGRRVTALIKSS
ncbi:MAG: hypothetical protein JW940_18725 [Polyangiaceae bacterium]|nr:hypothetical protein [Polyangiaceae bacterium]